MDNNTYKEKMAVIVATKDRLDSLDRLLESISHQGVKPCQIIIVDGGKTICEGILKKYPGLNLDYARAYPPSLTVQRNIGIKMIKEEATLVAFFDDDITLEDNGLKNMLKFWESASQDIGGTAFNNLSESHKWPSVFEKIFLVNAERPGVMLRSGFQSIPCSLKETLQVDWLIGCSMVYRRNIFDEFMFDERFSGYARYEDVEFSYRVSRKYKMFVIVDAKIKHYVELEKVKDSFALGKMQIINKLYFVKKTPGLSMTLCLWASLGLFLNNVVKGTIKRDSRYMLRSKGNIAGFMDILTGKART